MKIVYCLLLNDILQFLEVEQILCLFSVTSKTDIKLFLAMEVHSASHEVSANVEGKCYRRAVCVFNPKRHLPGISIWDVTQDTYHFLHKSHIDTPQIVVQQFEEALQLYRTIDSFPYQCLQLSM